MIGEVVASDEWKETLSQRGWIDLYQPADQFAGFLKYEQRSGQGHAEDTRPREVS